MTQITLTLPEAIVPELERQVQQRNMSLDEFAFKLLSEALIRKPVDALPSSEGYVEPFPELQALVARIKETPPNPAMIVSSTQTLAEVVAYWQSHPADESDITSEDWDRLWAEFERQQKVIDRADVMAEGYA